MKFRNYCIVVMGNLVGAKEDIVKIAETKPRYIDAKGILIATFASAVEPPELEAFFNHNGRSFMVFDLNKDSSGYYFDNEKLHKHLFGYLNDSEDKLKEMSNNLMDNISASTKDRLVEANSESKPIISKPIKKVEINYSDLTKIERETMINKILDKGFDRLTDSDKEMIKKISEFR